MTEQQQSEEGYELEMMGQPFTDQEHMRASYSMFDSAILQSLQDEDVAAKLEEVLEEDNDDSMKDDSNEPTTVVEPEPNQEEKDMLKEATQALIPPPAKKKKQKERRNSLLKKTLIKTFSANEEKTVLKVLKEIETIEQKHYKHGFKEINFTAGVMNCFVVAYCFGAYPEHFWIVYLLQSLYFIPHKFLNMIRAKPLNEALYYFDFCWMMNFNAIICLILVASPLPLPEAVRRFIYRGSFGIACGPLLGATMVLPFVAFVFHDVNTMTNVVIHAMPPMMLYTMRWHADEIRDAWPNIFQLQTNQIMSSNDVLQDFQYFPNNGNPFFWPGTGLGSIAGNAVLIYLLWFLPYTSWMLLGGLKLPCKNHPNHKPPVYDTVFHSFWRVGMCQTIGTLLWNRPVQVSQRQMEMDDYEVRDFLVYMAIHGTAVALSIPTLGFACNYSKATHMLVLLVILLAVVHRGSQRYTYYTTKMYSRIIRKDFLHPPDNNPSNNKNKK